MMLRQIRNFRDLYKNIASAKMNSNPVSREITSAESQEWIHTSDSIRHRTGRFFSIVGFCSLDTGRSHELFQPIIHQPEIGMLAFAFQNFGSNPTVLAQLKCEPGNVGAVHIAPTCQATQSNLSRAHNGSLPPGKSLVSVGQVISDSLQSEQGTKFLGKRNQNLAVEIPANVKVSSTDSEHLVQLPIDLLRKALAKNHLVNTDSRSVLVTSKWEKIFGKHLFAEIDVKDELTSILSTAWNGKSKKREYEFPHLLENARQNSSNINQEIVPLSQVPFLVQNNTRLVWRSKESSFEIRNFSISIKGRERENWDQPLISSFGVGEVALALFERDGVWNFIFKIAFEAGLFDLVELHPTICRPPGHHSSAKREKISEIVAKGVLLRKIRQSDEGGRFWRDITVYSIVKIQDPGDLPYDYICMSLREIDFLASRGIFTNESRSAISLLLSKN